jgi:hypothetical protein
LFSKLKSSSWGSSSACGGWSIMPAKQREINMEQNLSE